MDVMHYSSFVIGQQALAWQGAHASMEGDAAGQEKISCLPKNAFSAQKLKVPDQLLQVPEKAKVVAQKVSGWIRRSSPGFLHTASSNCCSPQTQSPPSSPTHAAEQRSKPPFEGHLPLSPQACQNISVDGSGTITTETAISLSPTVSGPISTDGGSAGGASGPYSPTCSTVSSGQHNPCEIQLLPWYSGSSGDGCQTPTFVAPEPTATTDFAVSSPKCPAAATSTEVGSFSTVSVGGCVSVASWAEGNTGQPAQQNLGQAVDLGSLKHNTSGSLGPDSDATADGTFVAPGLDALLALAEHQQKMGQQVQEQEQQQQDCAVQQVQVQQVQEKRPRDCMPQQVQEDCMQQQQVRNHDAGHAQQQQLPHDGEQEQQQEQDVEVVEQLHIPAAEQEGVPVCHEGESVTVVLVQPTTEQLQVPQDVFSFAQPVVKSFPIDTEVQQVTGNDDTQLQQAAGKADRDIQPATGKSGKTLQPATAKGDKNLQTTTGKDKPGRKAEVISRTPANTAPTLAEQQMTSHMHDRLMSALDRCQQLNSMLRAVGEACWQVRRRHPDIALYQLTTPADAHVTLSSAWMKMYFPTCTGDDPVLLVLAGWTGTGENSAQPQPLSIMLQSHMGDVWQSIKPIAESAEFIEASRAPRSRSRSRSPSPCARNFEASAITSRLRPGFSTGKNASSSPAEPAHNSSTRKSMDSSVEAVRATNLDSRLALPDLAQLLLGNPIRATNEVLRKVDEDMADAIAWWNQHFYELCRRSLLQISGLIAHVEYQIQLTRASHDACLADISGVEQALQRQLVYASSGRQRKAW